MCELEKSEKLQGHENHGMSTGIHGCLTFGWGKLDDFGYWEFPCAECAREYEKRHPKTIPCWPHTAEQIESMMQEVKVE